MQTVDTSPPILAAQPERNEQTQGWMLTWDTLLHMALGLLALALFASGLGSVPMTSPDEARQALAAWRFASPEAPGPDLVSDQPLVFLAQSATFGLFGGGEAEARTATALAGVLLVLSPMLLRGTLGRPRALLLSALLACSPVVLISARTSAPMIWAALFAMFTIWAGGRYWQTRAAGWAIATVCMFALLALMTEAGGTLLALGLAAATLIAWFGEDTDADDDEISHGQRLRRALAGFPWLPTVGIAALLIVALSTGFLTYQAGLTAVGEVLLGAVRGFYERTPDVAAFFPMLVSIFYEPWLWILGIATALWLSSGSNPPPSFLDRLAMGWLAVGTVLSLLFVGADAEHALWITLPLALLVSRLALTLFTPDDDAPTWARWVVAAAALALLAMGSAGFQSSARVLGRFDPATFQWSQLDALGIFILVFVLAFFIVGYFLVRSFWESRRVPLHGLALALLAFAAFTGIGAGWRTTVSDVENPVTFWRRTSPNGDQFLLRETLLEIAERTTRGYTEMPIAVLSGGDPAIEWAVRDFSAAQFTADYATVGTQPVVLARLATDTDRTPPLAGSYVGQDFTLWRAWPLSTLRPFDIPQWWSQGRALGSGIYVPESAALWVRTDVYAGTAAE